MRGKRGEGRGKGEERRGEREVSQRDVSVKLHLVYFSTFFKLYLCIHLCFLEYEKAGNCKKQIIALTSLRDSDPSGTQILSMLESIESEYGL